MTAIRGRELSGAVVKKISIVTRPANRTPFRIMKSEDAVPYWENPIWVQKRDFTAKKRKQLAASGHAMPDGSFPIQNEEDLHNAVRLAGNAKNPGKAKAHIKARASAIGATGAIPDTWGSKQKSEAPMSFFNRVANIMKRDIPAPKSDVTAVAVASTIKKADVDKMLNDIFPTGTKLVLRKADGVDFYSIEGASEDDDNSLVLKIDPNLSVVMSNAKKSLLASPVPPTFADKVVDNCVFPGVSMALDTMAYALYSGVMAAATPAEAVAKIDEVCNDAAVYMKALIGAIPSKAFKADISNLARVGGKLTLTFDGVNTDKGSFPNDPMASGSRDKNNGATNFGANGGSQGVDPDDGGDVDGDGRDVMGRSGGSSEVVDGKLPGTSGGRIQAGGVKTPGKEKLPKAKAADNDDNDPKMKDCPDCDGTGKDGDDDCPTCDGDGEVPAKKASKSMSMDGTSGYTTADNGNRRSNDGVIVGEDGGGGNRRQTNKGDDPVLAAITNLTKMVGGVSNAVKALQTEVGDVSTEVVKNAEGLKRVRATLKSSVNVDDPGEGEMVEKGDEDYNGNTNGMSLIDTGIDRRWINEDQENARGSNARARSN